MCIVYSSWASGNVLSGHSKHTGRSGKPHSLWKPQVCRKKGNVNVYDRRGRMDKMGMWVGGWVAGSGDKDGKDTLQRQPCLAWDITV